MMNAFNVELDKNGYEDVKEVEKLDEIIAAFMI